MELTYYAQRKSIKNGAPIAPNNRYGTRRAMERQFHLYCASACDENAAEQYDLDAIEWGTVEQGALERKRYEFAVEAETPEEPEASPEGE